MSGIWHISAISTRHEYDCMNGRSKELSQALRQNSIVSTAKNSEFVKLSGGFSLNQKPYIRDKNVMQYRANGKRHLSAKALQGIYIAGQIV
jgi:hypothetical protein